MDTVRDYRILALVASAHLLSHFFQLVLPPLFPVLRDELGITYVALGLLMSLFYAASGIGQTIAGFLVDRYGARRILASGLALLAGAIGAAGLAPSYGFLVPVFIVAGLGNSVFHPADYSILNTMIDPRRLGRAYSVHSICGNLGWIAAPPVVVGLSTLYGWRAAVVTVGALGVAAALVLATRRENLGHAPQAMPAADRAPVAADVRLLLAAPILMAFAYFALLSASMSGMQTFGVTALVSIYDVPLTVATGALTAYLGGNAVGILTGGIVADRTRRHDVVAAGGMLIAALLALVIASGAPPRPLLAATMGVVGLCKGITGPSRDMLVRSATPARASGKVFGFVYSGLDLGALAMPPLYGWLMDRGEPRAVFVVGAALMVVTVFTVLQFRRRAVPRAAPSAAGSAAGS
ncbi:MAG: MFS transporter [Candidatus Rokuibacteriota bacterium]